MLHQQRPPAAPPVPLPVVAPVVTARPRTPPAAATAARSTQAINARGELSRAGKVRSPVA
jgi:hypothetical protein